ncbi:MAG: glycosyltransferase [Microcoleaceae cyanobacterium]
MSAIDIPRVSVVIPVYNGEKTIAETIESVLAQSLQDFELIVINDGSTDKTLEVIASFHDPRLRVLSYPNAGLSASRNRGIQQASGEYISFIDADDLWTPDKLETQAEALATRPEAAVAYSWTDLIDQSSQFLAPDSRAQWSGNVYPHILLGSFPASGSNVLVRRSAFQVVGGFDESLKSAEDWEMWIRLAARYPFVVVPKAQILYRIAPGSMSTQLDRQEAESLKVIERAFQQAPGNLQYLKSRSLGNLYKYLTSRALDNYQSQRALVFFWKAVRHDPSLAKHRITTKVLFKSLALVLLPTPLAGATFARMGQWANTKTLLGYISLEVD